MNTEKIWGNTSGEKEEVKSDGSNGTGEGESTTTRTNLSETSNTSGQSNIVVMKDNLSNKLLEDEVLANSLNAVCKGGTKFISDGDGGSIEVPDYHLRLKGIELELKLKGHFKEKKGSNELVDAIYVLK